MKLQIIGVLVLSSILSVAVSFAQTKDDCSARTVSGKKASCCSDKARASLTSEPRTANGADARAMVLPAGHPAIDGKSMKHCEGSVKDCAAKSMRASDDCTAAEKAHCDMAKAGSKMDCCKNKTKGAEAKNIDGKSKQDKSSTDAKGTN